MWSVKNHVQEVKETQEQGFGDKEQYVSFLQSPILTEIQFYHQGVFVAARDCFGLVAFNLSCIGSVETWLVHGPT